jgi:hypothetical protein
MKEFSVFFVVVAVICIFVAACSSLTGVPQEGKEALDKWVQGQQPGVTYEIASAQKGTPQKAVLVPAPDEIWCVVLNKEIAYGGGGVSHFYLEKRGLLWGVIPALITGERGFLMNGCNNW